MLKEMILINSAEFDYAKIDLSKDIFFAGDNGTGKTSTIIALFYLFSGDNNSRKLGISADKKTFKEYYFPDDRNSFIIYVFDGFFIFMYKQNGEIFKYFSKKEFEIAQIVQESGELQSFKKIQEYLKDAPLTRLAKSSEYREIIYGQNRHYMDFKITEIKNYDVFVELFNQTFNVDKSIVDTNSIKRAIQKSINVEEKNIEFNYQNYMEEIRKFQDNYQFFRKFDKESSKIAQSFALKEEILTLESKEEELQGYLAYRQQIENKLLEEKQEKIVRLQELNRQYQAKKEQKEQSLKKVRERFAKEIAILESEIKEITKLKEKFEPKRYQEQQALLSQLPFLEKEQKQKQQQLTLLEADILNTLNTIDQEIADLTFKQEHELKEQKRIKLQQLKAKHDEEISQEKEKLRSQREHTEHRIESEQNSLKIASEELELKLESQKSQANELYSLYREKLNLFNEEQFRAKKELQKQIEHQEEQAQSVKKSLKALDERQENLSKSYQKELKLLAEKLWEERSVQNQIIKEKKAILWTPEGSFKEFLQQSGLSWEKELYPFMDSSLLSMSSEELSPKVLNSEMPLGLELNSQKLKSIPTQEEAEESIREAKVSKEQRFKRYKEQKRTAQENYTLNSKELKQEAKTLEQSLKSLEEQVEYLRKEITKINKVTTPEYEKSLEKKREKELSGINKKVEALTAQINSHKEQQLKLKEELKSFIAAQQKHLQAYEKELKSKEKQEKESIEAWLKEQKERLAKSIKEKEKNRAKLSKDDLIEELKKALATLKEQIQKSYDAKHYLKEYEEKKEFIDTLPQKESRLIMSRQNQENEERKLAKEERDLVQSSSHNHKALESLEQEIKKLQEGLEKSQNLELSNTTAKESQRYLHDLIEEYRSIRSNHKELRVNLKVILSSLSSLKNNPFADINFNMENFSLFEKLSEDLENIERLSELKDFKEKKLEILKETTNERYLNFVKSEIPSKLSSLTHSEEKFQEQVKRINENLATIDFSIVKRIKINPEVGNKQSIMSLLNEMNSLVQNLTISDDKGSLFFDRPNTNQDLQKIANLLNEIKTTLKGGAITLLDTIDLSLEFTENGTTRKNVTQIKNESSTGGTILLKMALAVSILGLYTQEKESTFFLILDEVSRLHSHNQDLLRGFANSRGFRIVFVTPEPVYAKPDEIKYYKFMRREDNRFEIVGLNG